MFSLEGMNQMTTCSSRDKRRAKANFSHEEPKPIKNVKQSIGIDCYKE